ncbi:LysR substrate-binding domain-containing protein [Phaeobacter porticola]|uniref:Transcriptional regulator, LysR family n=1 Tax=Phaeobacter porticola TaxID=1844006 RepID=A0A1L3IAJ2_9RHOB|nr:LysR substrate-binding domain-containing protein [Phaeobacter porticola]APG49063.1 transcriptional regulator, LysR family [Phaeobacter porticola]
MSRRHYDLPPLTTLSAFETAARHLSFKNAAQELSVTPGAVSHQIKALEGELGVALFQRKHRGVELTREGQDLFEILATSFRQISRQLQKIRQNGEEDAVTVGSTTAVAALWLSPVIIRFWRDYPDLNIHQITQDRPFQDTREFDFFIRYGRDPNATLAHTAIYRDHLVPVARPDIAQDLAQSSLPDLAQQRLIHLQSASPSWTTWADWFHELGHKGDIAVGTRVTSYSVALQIARKGAGIALGWKRLVQPMLDSNKLAIVGAYNLPAPRQFYLVGLPEAELSPNAQKLKHWILAEAQKSSV